MTRRRFIYRKNEAGEIESFEVGQDWTDAPRSTGDLLKFQFDNLQATDGTDISSKTKHTRYMKQNGLTLADDFKGEWSKAAADRAAFLKGQQVDKSRREAIGRAEYELSKRRRK